MVDPGIGRLLIASLHQGVADVSPMRLPFYEDWLSPTGLREGRMGLAPLGAVLSFLHREHPPDNELIPDRAGFCAAEWTYEAHDGLKMRLVRKMALKTRTRSAIKLGKSLVVETISGSKVATAITGPMATIEVRSRLFEYLREPSATPMRRYYAAAFAELLRRFDVDAAVQADDSCEGCRLIVTIAGEKPRSQAIFDVT
jgi:hypothetical protein